MTIQDIKDRISRGETVRSIVQSVLDRLEDLRDYNTVISVLHESALRRADEIDAKLQSGQDAGELAGVPFIAKDNFLTLDGHTTAASNMLKPFSAPYQSTAITKLESAGAILVAKANMDAFAHGGSTENSDFGPTKNARDASRVPGGSSGGSAAAVALNIVPFALGTDTGGSIRQPASFNGVVGIKPTYGAVSRFGVVAMASSTDTIGPLANSVDDAAQVFNVIAGQDERDATTLRQWGGDFYPIKPAANIKKIGIIKEFIDDGVQPDVVAAVRAQAGRLKDMGYDVQEVSIPSVKLALAVYYIVVPAEIASNLQRYDGVKFGHSAKDAESLQDLYGQTRDQGFNAENKRRVLTGTYVLSSGYIDAYYRKAQTVRTKLINEFTQAFKDYDALIGPVAPTTAFKLGENTQDPLKMYLADVMTVPASLVGLPAFSIPAGADSHGLPIGMQIMGEQRSDAKLFALAKQLQGESNG